MSGYPVTIYRQSLIVLHSSSESEDDRADLLDYSGIHHVDVRRVYPSLSSVYPYSPSSSTEVLILGMTSWNVPVAWSSELGHEYRELGQALSELAGLEDRDDWKIDARVYHTACLIGAELLANMFPVPRVLAHGPKSVVFNWSHKTDNIYLTVSSDRLSALISSPERIKRRMEYSLRELMDPSATLSSIRTAFTEKPQRRLITGRTDDSTELAG